MDTVYLVFYHFLGDADVLSVWSHAESASAEVERLYAERPGEYTSYRVQPMRLDVSEYQY